MYNFLVINVDELWLKGKNRPLYFKAMKDHLKKVIKLSHHGGTNLSFDRQRYILSKVDGIPQSTIDSILKIPGIYSVNPSICVPCEFDAIFPAVKEELEKTVSGTSTFKIITKRVDKRFPGKSMEINRKLGGLVLEHFPNLKVDVHNPEIPIHIKILDGHIYITTQTFLGVGGLPVAMSGHLVTMISGGFDSPMASYLMSKRGCKQSFIFFYAYPFVGDEVKDKILELLKILGQYQKFCKLYVVPFGEIQNKISKACREEYRTILFRHAMVECSNKLADIIKAEAILTGDALGQVSSQTMGNIALLDSSSRRPILRPLVGYNKIEIINLAKKIGTFDISVLPHDDACSMFAPKHPIIKPDRVYWEKATAELNQSLDMEKCLTESEVYQINPIGELTQIDNYLTKSP